MAQNLFLRLKKYAGGVISEDENYGIELLAALLAEFPSFRTLLIRELFNIQAGPEATIRTQVAYETRRFGRAILDLVFEDDDNFIAVEIKIESGLNYYEPGEEIDQSTYDQIIKYEDCAGFPTNKRISIYTLSKYPLSVKASGYRYFSPASNQVLWGSLFAKTEDYYRSFTSETPEKYLLDKFIHYLKEEGMAGFQGFKIDHLAELSRRTETDAICSDLRSLILQNVLVPGFKGKAQTGYGRNGIIYEPEPKGLPYLGIFVGLWLSVDQGGFKFPKETGPQAMVLVEADPKTQLNKDLLSSRAYARVSENFGRQSAGWDILLSRRPLIEFLTSNAQGNSLLKFYRESITDLQQSGLLAELTAHEE